MKEAIVTKGPLVKIVDSEIPKPKPNQVVIKVIYSGTNPKDWKIPEWFGTEDNSGDDIAGTVHEVGKDVFNFKVGDRVAAFHEMMKPGGSFAEYAVAYDHTTVHLPDKISFEEGATLPLAALTAAVGLYAEKNLGLPEPWDPSTEKTPLVVYGGASAVGAYAIQLASRSNLHPIIAVAGRGMDFVEGLIDRSKGDTIIDYRKGDDSVVAEMKSALGGQKLLYAYDAVSEGSTFDNICKVISEGGRVTTVLPGPLDNRDLLKGVAFSRTMVGDVHDNKHKDLGMAHFNNMARGLQEGWFKAHPYQVIGGGLAGVQEGLQNLKDGKASATKYLFKITDTPGL